MPRTSLFLALAGALAAAVLVAPGPVAASNPPRTPAQVRYDGVFTGQLTLRHRVDYGGPNYRKADITVDMVNTLLDVRFMDRTLIGTLGAGKVNPRGTGSSTTVDDEGEYVQTCAGDKITRATSVPPMLQPVMGQPTLYSFGALISEQICRVEGVAGYYKTKFTMSEIPVPVKIPPASIGASQITVPVDRTVPEEDCPGYEGSATVSCEYRLRGTLVLRLVQGPGGASKACDPPTRRELSRKATSASVRVRCGTACVATLQIRPLKGAGVRAVSARLKPGVAATLRTKISGRLRTAIVKSHGARFKVTYRCSPWSKTYSYVVRR